MRTVERPEVTDVSDGVVIRTEGLTKTYPTGVTAVDGLDLAVRRGRDLRPARPQRRGQDHDRRHADDPRRSRPSGRAIVGGIDVVAHPGHGQAVIGVVPQTNTLDRSLTVWENLYFHGRYFGMGKRESQAHRRRDRSRTFRLADRADADVRDAVGRHGAAAHGRAQHHPPAAHALPGRADVRARPAEPARAVGHHRRAPRARGRRSCSRRTTWRKPTSSASGSRSWTTASCWRSTPPPR